MVAVDTNVLVRFLTKDDAQQMRAAARLIESEQVWIAKTVLLETNWILTSTYGFTEEEVRTAFEKLFGLPSIRLENEPEVIQALALSSQALEFADALHLASTPSDGSFASFDKKLIRRARRAGVTYVRDASHEAG